MCKLFFFDYIILESVLLFLNIGEPSIATSKMSLNGLKYVSCVIPTVLRDVVILVMCALY